MKLFLMFAMVFAVFTSSSIAGENAKKKTKPTEEKGKIKSQSTRVKEKMNPQYVISVTQSGKSLGDIVLELFPEIAPKHCANFDSLVAAKFYDGTAFHRVIPGFMIQGGDPNTKTDNVASWGMGDPSQKRVPAEFNKTPHVRGIVSAARSSDPNSATSQFFICVDKASFLDNQYTVYGQVLSGMEVADMIVNTPRNNQDRPNDKVTMKIKKKSGVKEVEKKKAGKVK